MNILDSVVQLIPLVVLCLIPIIFSNVVTFFVVKLTQKSSTVFRFILVVITLFGTVVGFPLLVLPLFAGSNGWGFILFLIFCIPTIFLSYIIAISTYLRLDKENKLYFHFKPIILAICVVLAIAAFFLAQSIFNSFSNLEPAIHVSWFTGIIAATIFAFRHARNIRTASRPFSLVKSVIHCAIGILLAELIFYLFHVGNEVEPRYEEPIFNFWTVSLLVIGVYWFSIKIYSKGLILSLRAFAGGMRTIPQRLRRLL